MMPNDLAEVARAVAEALGLEDYPKRNYANKVFAWGHSGVLLHADGSNLTAPYWRCRCEDWLHERGVITFEPPDSALMHEFVSVGVGQIVVDCPLAEAPARLVAAVWRKQNER